MAARGQYYNALKQKGYSKEEAMEILQKPNKQLLENLYKIGNLQRFFKEKNVTPEKLNLLKLLPGLSTIPAIKNATDK
ncbi:MAG: hypothetical protein ACOH2V_00320 [Candidatus Saccharimonadaceae bacterium]